MTARPSASHGLLVGAGLLVVALLVDGLLAWSLRRAWPGPTAAVLLVALVLAALATVTLLYYLVGLLTLRYCVSRDGLVLHWAASRTTVPMSDITHILQGRPYGDRLHGIHWPGHEVGRSLLETEDGTCRELLVLATVPPDRQLIVVTPHVAYALSPTDRSAFVRELALRRRMGPVSQLEHATRHPLFSRVEMTRDRTSVRLLTLALGLNLLAIGWLVWHLPSLPARVALWYQYDTALGRPVAVASQPLALAWQLPVVALLALALNSLFAAAVYGRARLGAQFLAGGAAVLQFLVFVTLLAMSR